MSYKGDPVLNDCKDTHINYNTTQPKGQLKC